mmetsp:Transcript_12489/g.25876  ORF Transcript_12489/g.25876 Transcript_12489/m.25876 type:complete len:466 (+) Transcript_12489:70-1467(+)
MTHSILVQGLPLVLKRTAAHLLAKTLGSIVKKALDSVLNSKGKIENVADNNQFKVHVTSNRYHRVEETIRIQFADRLDSSTVAAVCQVLQETAAQNPIAIPETNKLEEHASGHDDGNIIEDGGELKTPKPSFIGSFSLGAGRLRDHAFPTMPYELRRQMKCDGIGAFSLTPDSMANRTAKLLCSLLEDALPGKDRRLSVVDGMSGVGGNTLGFLKYWNDIVSLELDPSRASMLEENIGLWQQWKNRDDLTINVGNQCLIDFLSNNRREFDLLFLDPPWGGPQYKEIIQQQNGNILLHPTCETQTHEGKSNHAHTQSHIVDCRKTYKFSEAALAIVHSNAFQIIAIKIPDVYDETLIVDPLVHDESLGPERPHPFRFQFGKNSKLIVIVRNKGCNVNYANGPDGLDRMIFNIMGWHNSMDLLEDDGCREHRPEFYDFEKKRWIMLKKWKGSRVTDPKDIVKVAGST